MCKRFLVGVQEVPSSNLGGPTKFLKELRAVFRDQVWLFDHDFLDSIWTPGVLA